MDKEIVKISAVTAVALFLSTGLVAGGVIIPAEQPAEQPVVEVKKSDKPKRQLNGNMTLKYNVLPGAVDNIGDLFSEGIFYGRLRNNNFYWDWDVETSKLQDNKNSGAGGSLIFKSASLNSFSFMLGYYGSLNPEFLRMAKDEVQFSKSGKDTFSRYKVFTGGGYGMQALGEAYLQYNNDTVDVVAGRQLFESVFTKSNDTKMIPNTFDGVSAAVKVAPKTKIRFAWFGAQKLRDHETSHDVITFNNTDTDNRSQWTGNDDAAVHKGLNTKNFLAAGVDPDNNMFLADMSIKYIDNLKLDLSYLQIPNILQDFVVEAHYKIPITDTGWSVRPGIRYFYQMDDGGGDIAGNTNLTGKTDSLVGSGYDASTLGSLDATLFNARLDILMPNKKGFFRFGYSKVGDEADIITPWRGFPTGGFTRAMAQYNWTSNTETLMARAVYKFNDTWKASIRYAIQDFDDNKDYVSADSNVIHIDTWTNITKDFQTRLRFGHVTANDDTLMIHNTDPSTLKPDYSYNEYRLEFNYMF
ncbi:MAG: hypothetical protein U9R27_05625 [Campylobacterota bacterium]|nr:hypothetical protein [Campylobacterota bacterium]